MPLELPDEHSMYKIANPNTPDDFGGCENSMRISPLQTSSTARCNPGGQVIGLTIPTNLQPRGMFLDILFLSWEPANSAHFRWQKVPDREDLKEWRGTTHVETRVWEG